MIETSTPRSNGPPTKTELYRELHVLADKYFNGPYTYPDTRDIIGRRLRDLILTIDLRENAG
jgi:hypothetical protein